MAVPDVKQDIINVSQWHLTIDTTSTEAAAYQATMDATGLNADEIGLLGSSFRSYRNIINTAAAQPGLQADLRALYNDPVFSLAAEQVVVDTAISDVLQWLKTNMPKDVTDRWLLLQEFDAGFNIVPREFTPGQLAGLSALMVPCINLIA